MGTGYILRLGMVEPYQDSAGAARKRMPPVETLGPVSQDRAYREPIAGWQKTKKATFNRSPFGVNELGQSGATGALGAATGAASTEIDAAVQLEAVLVEIDLDRLRFFQKFRIHDELKTVDIKRLVRIGKLIQSHGQSRAASPAFIEENTDRFDIFSFEIFGDLLDCRLCNFKHDTLLENKKTVRTYSNRKPPIGFSCGN
jgi:hypothetical protein